MGLGIFSPLDYSSGGVPSELLVAASFESAMATVAVKFPQFSAQVKRSLVEMVPVFIQVAKQLAVNTKFNVRGLRANLKQRQPLYTKCVATFLCIAKGAYLYQQIVSWTLLGNTSTTIWLPMLRTWPLVPRHTTTTCTTSSVYVSFSVLALSCTHTSTRESLTLNLKLT